MFRFIEDSSTKLKQRKGDLSEERLQGHSFSRAAPLISLVT